MNNVKKRTLLGLKTRRTALTIIIDDLVEDKKKASAERKHCVEAEIVEAKRKLSVVKADLSCVAIEVDRLEDSYSNKEKVK